MNGHVVERAERRIAQLAVAGLDLPTFWLDCSEAIATVVPHDVAPCWFTMDPASLLVTSHFQEGLPEIPGEWLAAEYADDDVNKMADVARSASGVATLHDATEGHPERSPRYLDIMVPYGVEQELIAALRSPTGESWGSLGLYRERGRRLFDEAELRFLRAASGRLAQGARRGLLIGEATDPEGPEAPGLLVLGPDWTLESATPGVERWLAELPGGEQGDRLPPAVLSVAGQATRTSEHEGHVTFARVLSTSGRWVVLHGAPMVAHGPRRVAVIIEPAHPARIVSLLMSAHQLTDREQDVTRAMLRGLSTDEIATELFISTHTVRQHVKNILAKTGSGSRRELVSKIFFNHYEPRLRDNERRAVEGRPLRGGPRAN